MTEPNQSVTNRRQYLKGLGAASVGAAAALAGCSGGSSGTATGTLATAVTDQPGDIADFQSCVVTIQGIWLKPAEGDATDTVEGTGVVTQSGEDVEESEAREYHEFDEPQEADLVKLQDGNTKLIDDREVTAQSYEFLQLDVTGVEGTLSDGSDAQVKTPGNAPLQFKQAFEVRENQRTRFTADFTPVKQGRTNRYILQPVATNTEVTYEAAGTTTQS